MTIAEDKDNDETVQVPKKNKNDVYNSLNEVFESIDFNSHRVANTEVKDIDSLLKDLFFSHSFDEVLKLRALFSWISFVDVRKINVKEQKLVSNCEKKKKEKIEELVGLLNNLKHSASYAEVFKALTRYVGLDSVIIKGWAKGEDYVVGDEITTKPTNHTWNAVRLQDDWFLVDCFWSRCFSLNDLDDFFFLTEPSHFVSSHLPEDPKWQLLSNPISSDLFTNNPYLKPHFFKLNLHFDPGSIKYRNDMIQPGVTALISLFHSGRVGFSFKLIPSSAILKLKNLKDYVLQEISDLRVSYFVRPPSNGSYYLNVFANSVFSGYHENVIIHKSIANFKLNFKNIGWPSPPFPQCSDACWGVPQIYRHIISPLLPSSYLVCPDEPFQFSVHKSKEEKVYVRLVNVSRDHHALKSIVSMVENDNKADVSLNFGEKIEGEMEGEFGVEVYVKPSSKHNKFLFLCQFLVTRENHLGLKVDRMRNSEKEKMETKPHIIPKKEIQTLEPDSELKTLFLKTCQLNLEKPVKSPTRKEPKSPMDILEKFKLNLVSYAEVFNYFCKDAKIECQIVEGQVKEVLKSNRNLSLQPHSWNIVTLGNKKIIVDCCWGARRMIDDFTRSSLISKPDLYYLDPPPSQLIFSHFPNNPSHQLLDKPLGKTEFDYNVPLKPSFFRHNLSLGKFKVHQIKTGSQFNLDLFYDRKKTPNIEFSSSLMLIESESVTKIFENHIMQFEDEKEDSIHFLVRLPKNGSYRLVIFCKSEGDVFEEIFEHEVLSNFQEDPQPPFPPPSVPTWGDTDYSKKHKISCTRKCPLVNSNERGEVELIFVAGEGINFKSILKSSSRQEKGSVLLRRVDGRLLVSIQCPNSGEFCFELYASDPEDHSNVLSSKQPMFLSHQLLIHSPSPMNSTFPHPFPSLSSNFLGPQSANKFFNVCLSGMDDHFFKLSENQVTLNFTNQHNIKLCSKLFRVRGEEFLDNSFFILQQNKETLTSFQLTLPSRDLFVFQLYGSEGSISNMMNIFNLLLHCSHLSHPIKTAPVQFNEWNGVVLQPLYDGLQKDKETEFKIQFFKEQPEEVVLRVGEEIIDFQKICTSPCTWSLFTSLPHHLSSSPIEVCGCFGSQSEDFSTLLEYRLVH